MNPALEREKSRRFNLLQEEYVARMNRLSDREEELKAVSRQLEELDSDFESCLLSVREFIREQAAMGSLPQHFFGRVQELDTIRANHQSEFADERAKILHDLSSARSDMGLSDREYSRQIRQLDEEFDKYSRRRNTYGN